MRKLEENETRTESLITFEQWIANVILVRVSSHAWGLSSSLLGGTTLRLGVVVKSVGCGGGLGKMV